ncbi:Na/Pi cotransporter family protein [Litoribrevibacter albus]|uniref:Na/Pi cotransporter n=1 Tax=Litoribrevibacter albus TaxID=1473156 RepID=A0AA37S8Q1_9GAMM|nr:Na/Pi cotransporter family protein [Litoribrevibacter albus]GLQ30578.1 Na/Pi cotransporter [Litoribrevibacter albus]
MNDDIQWLSMFMGLFGGLALFLYGIGKMCDSLQEVSGKRLKSWLASVTKNRWLGAISGASVTAVIQSSSVTTVLVVGFVSAGLLSMTQSIGVIMGANIGTTVTAQIVAFKVTKISLLIVAIGFSCWFFGKQEKIKAYGSIILGLGMLFLGMNIMSEAMEPLKDYPPFLELLMTMSNPVLSILIGTLFTTLVQSSSATTAIVVVMAGQGFITLETGIALALGANVGTCITTAVLASIGKTIEARRAAMIHVLFNILGVMIWLPLISVLASLSIMISPETVHLSGVEQMAKDAPRQIANANTLFNVINTLLFLPFAHTLGRLACWFFPDRKGTEKDIIVAKYLDSELIESPALALARVRLEVAHMGSLVLSMIARFEQVIGSNELKKVNEVSKIDDQVDVLQDKLLSYLGSIKRTSLTNAQMQEVVQLMATIDHIEHVGDDISVGLARVARKFVEFDVEVSEETREDFQLLFAKLETAFAYAMRAVASEDQKAAQDVLLLADDIESVISRVLDRQAMKLKRESNRVMVFRVEMAFCEQARHIYSLARRIAILMLPKHIAPDT